MSAADLYHERILALARSARGTGALAEPRIRVQLDNPLCGDRITLDVRLEEGRITALAHHTRGCLLSEAAAAALADLACGLTYDQAARLRQALAAMLAGESGSDLPAELQVFAPVAAVKSRHECILLPFDALLNALRTAQGA